MIRKTSVSVCLSVSYKSGVCISLSKDVNTETKKSIIWLEVLYGCERYRLALREECIKCTWNAWSNIRSEFLTKKNEKIHDGKQIFRYSPHFRLTQFSRFLSVGRLTDLVCSVANELEETLHQLVLSTVRPFASTQGPMKLCDSPRSDVSMCALIGVEDILSVGCEMWFE